MLFKIVNGVCRPQTFEVLETFKNIQREANRSLDSRGAKLLYVDGRIGSKTVAAVNSVLGTSYKNCGEVSLLANMLLGQLRSAADNKQLPIVADPESLVRKVTSPPSVYDADKGEVVHPSALGGVSPIFYVLLFGLGGYYYYGQKTKSGKKPRRKS